MPENSLPALAAPRTGGRILADALRLHGTDRVFCVPGESYLDLLDALYDIPAIQICVAKHEGAAANMAEADGKLTGRPGICLVTRGPGATHACVGVHTAFQDSTPLILLIGQVAREVRGREAFQEVEFRQMFAPFSKWVAEIEDAARIPEYLLRAFQTAASGRPGPVVLALPEDVLSDTCSVADTAPFRAVQASPARTDMEQFRGELARARQPLVVVGGSGWTTAACAEFEQFANSSLLPVASSFRRQDLFPNQHPCYAGHLSFGLAPFLAGLVRDADLIIALGTRLGDVSTSGYTLLDAPRPKQRLIHIHADPAELGRVYQSDLAVNSSPANFAAVLETLDPVETPPWREWTGQAHANFLQFTSSTSQATPTSAVDLTAVVTCLAAKLPPDAIVTNGAGNYTIWVHRFYSYRQRGSQLAPTSGAMGYGFPAAIAAKLRFPARTVVCFAGDGCFLMYPQELATALQCGAAVIVIVVNNGMYGTIRMHQERRFPGRVTGTNISNPDFVALAKSFGASAELVESTGQFSAAFDRAVQACKPALLELRVDPKQITPDRRFP